MDNSISKAIETVAARADSLLWSAFGAAANNRAIPSSGIRMIFPIRRWDIRTSEQEARFFFVHALEESAFLYSVETPTGELYRQRGADLSRARFDITARDSEARQVANCEFKCGGISPNRKQRDEVVKDLEKLLRDPGDGLWFHLLESVNNSTLSNVLRTIAEEITVLLQKYTTRVQPKTLAVHVCILRHGFSIHREVAIDPRMDPQPLHASFSFEYRVTRNELTAASESQGWRICRRSPSGDSAQHAVGAHR